MEAKDIFIKHPDSLSTEKQVSGLINDYFPTEPKKKNTLIQAYKVGIIEMMRDSVVLTQALKNKIIRILNENYGTDTESADWAVQFWFKEYGAKVLGKKIQTKEEVLKITEKRRRAILTIAKVLVILSVVFSAAYYINGYINKPRVPLDSYVDLTFTGYDDIGFAELSYDSEALFKDYGEVIKLNKNSSIYDKNKSRIENGERITDILIEYLDGSISQSEYLSNGDRITYSWKINEDLIKQNFDINIDYHEISFTVNGLAAVKKRDPFDNLEISFSGIEPHGIVQISKKTEEGIDSEYKFSIDRSDNLKNGDTVNVTVLHDGSDIEFLEKCIDKYNARISNDSKSYIVKDLDYYVTSSSQLDEATIKSINKKVNANIMKEAMGWPEELELNDVKYIGNYYLNRIKEQDDEINHKYIAVYKVTAAISIPKKTYTGKADYYYVAEFDDLINNYGNSCISNINKYKTSDNAFDYKLDIKKNWVTKYQFQFTGYASIDDLYHEYVEPQKEGFSMVKTIKE